MTLTITNVQAIDSSKGIGDITLASQSDDPRILVALAQLEKQFAEIPHVASVNGVKTNNVEGKNTATISPAGFDAAAEPMQAAASSISKHPKINAWLQEEMQELRKNGISAPDIGKHTTQITLQRNPEGASNNIVPSGFTSKVTNSSRSV
jgi:hypothetical protein